MFGLMSVGKRIPESRERLTCCVHATLYKYSAGKNASFLGHSSKATLLPRAVLRRRYSSKQASSGFLIAGFLVPNLVSRCAGKIPTQHASDTANDYPRPLTTDPRYRVKLKVEVGRKGRMKRGC
jgi:hypothetical protein